MTLGAVSRTLRPQLAGTEPRGAERAANLDLGLPTLPHAHQPQFREQAPEGGPNGSW